MFNAQHRKLVVIPFPLSTTFFSSFFSLSVMHWYWYYLAYIDCQCHSHIILYDPHCNRKWLKYKLRLTVKSCTTIHLYMLYYACKFRNKILFKLRIEFQAPVEYGIAWILTNISMASCFWDIGKQHNRISDANIRVSTVCLQNVLLKFK